MTGTVQLGGVVVIVFSPGTQPEDGQYVPILEGGTVIGQVDRVDLEYERTKCRSATAEAVSSSTEFGALLSVSDDCKGSKCVQ